MFTKRKFPSTRLRRLRSKPFIRDLVRENVLLGDDLIQPLFLKEDLKGTEAITQMPGISRFGLDSIENEMEIVTSFMRVNQGIIDTFYEINLDVSNLS